MVDSVNTMIASLSKTDAELGLFALSDSKSKQAVQYPEPFAGSLGENVFKFVKDFQDAIAGDQIRKSDEVKTLSKCLKGEAKSFIGDHHKDLVTALEQLKNNYDTPRLIVFRYMREFEKSLGNIRNWGNMVPRNALMPSIKL